MKGRPWLAILVVIVAGTLAGGAHASPGATTLVSVDSAGNQGNDASSSPAVSADGRYVAFSSFASNLVPGDTNETQDIFVHDLETGGTMRVSVDSGGTEGNGWSFDPAISADGRYVAFWSRASNLVAGDTNTCLDFLDPGTCPDVFVHDWQTGATTRVSVDGAGNQGNGASTSPFIGADGRYVAFSSLASNLVSTGATGVFVHDRQTGETTHVGVGGRPAMSADGRYVAFSSFASDLVPGDTNATEDIFVHDRQTGDTTRVSVDSSGNQGNGQSSFPDISADGRYVAFDSGASNLVPGDTNGGVFVHDRQTGQTGRVSLASTGTPANGSTSDPAISADGRYVAFWSVASNLVPGDITAGGDIYVHDRLTGDTTLASVNSAGNQGNDPPWEPAISADGRYVAFSSFASNLVPGDTNETGDIFVHDRDDGDGVDWVIDNCPTVANADQADSDSDGVGDVCEDQDSDKDGCIDAEELPNAPVPKPGSRDVAFDPMAWFDFYDVPVPANPDPAPSGRRNQAIDMGDVIAVLFYVGAYENDVPNGNGVDYDSVKGSCDPNGDTVPDKEGLCYDRWPSPVPDPHWVVDPPNGIVDVGDVLAVLAQAGLSCAGPP